MPRVLLTVSALYAGAAVWLDRYGRREPAGAAFEAIIVLGCRVYPDGRPSRSLVGRVERAVALFDEGRAPRLVLTGGFGDAPISEARAAAAIARSLGVPKEALILEERSTSTEENAREAALLLSAERVLVVTDSYHVFRAERVFGRYFACARGAGARGRGSARLRGALREVAAVGAYALRGRL